MKRAAALLLLAIGLGGCGGRSGVTVEGAWSQPVPPVAEARAVYMTIANSLQDTVTLTGATSDMCSSIEFHETSIGSDAVMTMRRLPEGLPVPAGDSVVLEPRGLHLMCLDPDDATGFDMTLQFDGVEDLEVHVVVESR